ncbi:MAG: recombination protein O N-terminal domain-containing protein [Flavobacteriales bacterium]|nr:recombination protein O N-terminal domain-containing protein [Flavobacteriales bacterium]HRH68403.1 recombination protein O N-terminal domain-containing protein [Flavobacteriales bacterium]
MLHTTKAIVLKVIRHGDRTVVLKAYTEEFGLRSYMVRAGGKGGIPQALLQPLNRLDLVVNEQPERDIHTIREARVDRPYKNVPFDAVRGTLALFVQEVLYKVLRGEAADPAMYGFIQEALEAMDTSTEIRNYPLIFLLRLSAELGFSPAPPMNGEDAFDMREGEFIKGVAPHGHTLGPPHSTHLISLLEVGFGTMTAPVIPGTQRRELLDHLLLYFRMHIEGLGELRSPAVLHQALG